jgi:peptide/nickel transport system permease protein
MIRFVLRRILNTVPTLVGISLVTFVILNLSMSSPHQTAGGAHGLSTARIETLSDDRSHFLDLHLPLFINLSIEDARSNALNQIVLLKDDRTAARAERLMVRAGGAWLPYLIPALDKISPKQRERTLDALDKLAPRMGLERALEITPDRGAFWKRYWQIYGSDFTPTRSAMLVRRLLRHDDHLAEVELKRLGTYCLPQMMDALDGNDSVSSKSRIVSLTEELTGINDPLVPEAEPVVHTAVLKRWKEWWHQRYDRYTVFKGLKRVTGSITETRYFRWLGRMLTFDFGVSVRDGRPIINKLMERLPITLLLSVLALAMAYMVAIPLGVLSAVRRGGFLDRSIMGVLFVLYSLPSFWLAMILLKMFSGTGYLDIFPAQGLSSPFAAELSLFGRLLDTAHHLVLPVFCLSAVSMAMLARYQRVGMLQVIDRDFMRTARAKGLSQTQAIIRHGLRNSVIPVVTMLGLQIPYLVSGSVVVERIFGIPGMGYETFEAIRSHDQPWLLAVVTVTAIMTMVGIVFADAFYALIDPRIAPGQAGGKR